MQREGYNSKVWALRKAQKQQKVLKREANAKKASELRKLELLKLKLEGK